MNTIDSPKSNGDDGDVGQVFDLIELPPEDRETAWQQFSQAHVRPSRLLRAGAGLETLDESDRQHLEWCETCRTAFEQYSVSGQSALPLVHAHEANGRAVKAMKQKELWPTEQLSQSHISQIHLFPSERDEPSLVPAMLREHLHVKGPVVFGGNEVAFESWQFGRFVSDDKNSSVTDQYIEVIVDKATELLMSWNTSKDLLLVCFGRAMHRCGTRIAVRLGEMKLPTPHVVLAHDYYSPTVVCDDKEFLDADVIVLMDVVHSGDTLDGLLALCVRRGAHRVRGLVLIDQSGGKPLCAEWHSLWREPKEQRISLEAFVHRASEAELRQLRRFEPNYEIARVPSAGMSSAAPIKTSRLSIDNDLTKHIHDTGALKRDYVIGQKRYPYVVNVLDLIKKSPSARSFIFEHAATALSDLRGQDVALAFHAGRKQRAGRLAKLFSSMFGWPIVPIGSVGPAFTVSDTQLKQLASYDIVVIVDAALRTGDTLSALVAAIEDKMLFKHTRFISLCVLNSLSNQQQDVLASTLGIEIRSLFDLPLPPPAEEVRHWASGQKALIRSRMASSGAFAGIEHILSGYCAPRRGLFSPNTSIEDTRDQLEHAVHAAQSAMTGSERIAAACVGSAPQFIRHLPVSEVVHDRDVQELLIGVMFNSVKPSLKESAAFALASARNYEWMTMDWLKLNRPFLTSTGQAWKSIVMVECEMKLSGRQKELNEFRNVTLEYKEQELSRMNSQSVSELQMFLPNLICDESVEVKKAELQIERSTNSRLIERLDALVAAAD